MNIQQIDAAIRELAAKQLPLGDDGKPIKVLVNGVEWSGLPAGVFVKFQVTS